MNMMSDANQGFPLREHVIKSGKENIEKYKKYVNVKIIKRYSFVSLSHSTFYKISSALKTLH